MLRRWPRPPPSVLPSQTAQARPHKAGEFHRQNKQQQRNRHHHLPHLRAPNRRTFSGANYQATLSPTPCWCQLTTIATMILRSLNVI